MTEAPRPQRRQVASASSASSGLTMTSIRSWDSEVRTSKGSIPRSRRGTRSRWIRMPVPALAADSEVAQQMPAPPRSWMPTTTPRSMSSRQASMSSFSVKGSPTCTLGRLTSEPSSKADDASTETPPMPSRPVLDPSSRTTLPGPWALASMIRCSGATPTHMTLTSGFPE